jgi:bifunctional DNase/RNase
MEESSQNENITSNNDEIYMSDVVMEDERMQKEFEIHPSVQTKIYILM